MEQGKTELFSGLQLDKQQCSWSPSKITKRKNSTEQTELESQVKQLKQHFMIKLSHLRPNH